MVKTHNASRFCLYTLEEIRDSKEIILQIHETRSTFEGGKSCYLCEVVNPNLFYRNKNEQDLINEICKLNEEKRKYEQKIARLEKILTTIGAKK
jgi:hypothetical protein